MTTPYEDFVNIALGKALSSDVTLPTANDIPVFTGIGRQVTGKTTTELGLALSADLDIDGTLADNSDTKYPSQKAVKTYADTKQAALADVVTAETYGSSTQVPVITFNAKGIATTVNLATIAEPVLTEANFSVAKTGQPTFKVTWVLTALTQAWAWTVPNKDIDLGDLPSVATTNANTYSGTLGGILGGSNNNVSGTSNLAIGANYCTLAATNQVALGAIRVTDVTWSGAVIQSNDSGNEYRAVAVTTCLRSYSILGIMGAATHSILYSATTAPKSYLGAIAGKIKRRVAIHTVSIVGRMTDYLGGIPTDSQVAFAGKRRVVISNDGTTSTVTVTTEGTDYTTISAAEIYITDDAGTLNIQARFASEAAQSYASNWVYKVESLYTN